ncbi:glutamate-5-semialdehyde dehydrogenase [Hutsoniella sourekii]
MDQRLIDWGSKAKQAANQLRKLDRASKDQALEAIASHLEANIDRILSENKKDLQAAREAGLSEFYIDRLVLDEGRIKGMVGSVHQVVNFPDPVAKTDMEWINQNGLRISKRRVPLGVIGIIYESRPNVTVDATALALKSGNAVILRGGKEALHSNQVLVEVMKEALAQTAVSPEAVQFINDPSRELSAEFMQLNDYVDTLIPRGSAGLIQAVLRQATIPVIETGTGNCHLYIHQDADLAKAKAILLNGKTQRNSVCNALESLIIDQAIAQEVLPELVTALASEGVEVRGDDSAQAIDERIVPASEEDYATEFLDKIISVQVAPSYDQAVALIQKYSTGHSDAIVTESYSVAQDFMNDIDSACVYVNASTRFSDGEVFGFGGEIGISTQKLHARGPMGIDALTSYKYTIQGNGQVRQ